MRTVAFACLLTAFLVSTVFAAERNSEPVIRKALASGRPTLVDFGANFCIPCKKMKPVLEALEREYKGRANVIFVDVKEENGMGAKYRVQMIPTQLFYDAAGKEVKRHIGFMDKPEIVKVFREIGVK